MTHHKLADPISGSYCTGNVVQVDIASVMTSPTLGHEKSHKMENMTKLLTEA